MSLSISDHKKIIRQKMRLLRQSLAAQQQVRAGESLCETFFNNPQLRKFNHVAGYLAQDGELPLNTLFSALWQLDKNIYLPKLRPLPPNRLWFAPYSTESKMVFNKFQIPEPQIALTTLRAPSQIQLVLFPLVAFDAHGGRLGMGGGFYDRTFAHLRDSDKRPIFAGVAYDQQLEVELPNERWDIPLDMVITPTQIFEFNLNLKH